MTLKPKQAGRQWSQEFADAPLLDEVPRVIDVSAHAPVNPPIDLQQKFVGSNLLPAFEEAQRFVNACFRWWPTDSDPASTGRVLDFGSGWGRISRMLLRRIDPHMIYASDVDVEMTALVQQSLPGVNTLTNPPFPPSVFGAGTFDAVVAFSVFSHLSEDAHAAWAREFGRIIRPGGRAFITVLEENFIDQVAASQRAVASGEEGFAANLASLLSSVDDARETVQRGDFLYAAGTLDADGPRLNSFYSWAVAPRQWVERTWGKAGFRVVRWAPTGKLFQQAFVVLEREPLPSLRERAAGAYGGRLMPVARSLKRALGRS